MDTAQGLDAENRSVVISLLDKIVRSAGQWVTLLHVSHHEDELVPSSTHVLEVKKGQVVFCGAREEYEKSHATRLVGAGNKGP